MAQQRSFFSETVHARARVCGGANALANLFQESCISDKPFAIQRKNEGVGPFGTRHLNPASTFEPVFTFVE